MVKIIALDEFGVFEKRSSGIRFVGGYTINSKSYEEEKNRIESFLIDYCNNFNSRFLQKYTGVKAYYPNSLHGGSGRAFFRKKVERKNGKDVERLVVANDDELKSLERMFYNNLSEEVAKYISGRKGTMYIYLDPFVDDVSAERDIIGNSNVLDIAYGANFYERMATMALFNQAFFSTDDADDEISFEVATRTLGQSKDGNGAELPEGTADLYEVYTNSKAEIKSTITNTSTYKTAVAGLLYAGSVNEVFLNTKYKFNVKSINYDSSKETTPFHYLADLVCGYIRRVIQKTFSVGEFTAENKIDPSMLLDFCNATGIQVQIYDRTDTLYREMLQYAKAGSLAKYQYAKYCILNSGLLYQGFYKNYWIPKLENYILRMLSNSNYRAQVKSLIPEFVVYANGFMGPREINYEAGLFVASELSKIVSQMDDYRDRKLMLFRLYDIILRGHNHRGSIAETQKYISKCEEYKAAVGIEEYISHTLRTLVFYFNALRFEDALSACLILEEPVAQLKNIYTSAYNKSSKISTNITEDRNAVQNYCFPLAGKLYSSIGQAYGFLGQYAKAKKYFQKALKEFEKNSADYTITLSHFMQLLISNKKKADYEVYSNIYFGSSNLWEQLTHVLSANDGGFALLVFVKAFRIFYANDAGNSNILEELIRRTSACKDHKEHPWELIYKNLYEAILKQTRKFKKQDFEFIKEAAMSCVQEADATIKMIQISMRLQFEENIETTSVNEFLNPDDMLVCNTFIENTESMSLTQLKEWFASKLTYEYM